MARVIARNRRIMEMKEEKEKLIVTSCTQKIRLSPNENRESQIQKNVLKNDEKLQSCFPARIRSSV